MVQGKRQGPPSRQPPGNPAGGRRAAPATRPDAASDAGEVRVTWGLYYRDPTKMTDDELDAKWAAEREAEARGDPKVNPLALAFGHATPEDVDRMRALPRRTLPVIVAALPDWLDGLPDDAPVREFAAGFDSLRTAGAVRWALRETLARQVAGRLTAAEVAHALAAVGGAPPHAIDEAARAFVDDLVTAFARGRLEFYESTTALEPVDAVAERARDEPLYGDDWAERYLTHYGDRFTTPEAVDRWLDRVDPQRRRPRMPAGPWSSRSPAVAAADAPRRTTHRLKVRRHDLDAPIEEAIRRTGQEAPSGAEVWPHLEDIVRETVEAKAHRKSRQFPDLVAVTAEGVIYESQGAPKVFTRKNLGDRLRNRRASTKRSAAR